MSGSLQGTVQNSTVQYSTDKRTLCEAHYKVQSPGHTLSFCLQRLLGNCKRCGGTLEGSILKIDGAKFHLDCFTCKICEVSLKDSSVLTDDEREIYCQFCHDE